MRATTILDPKYFLCLSSARHCDLATGCTSEEDFALVLKKKKKRERERDGLIGIERLNTRDSKKEKKKSGSTN